MSGIGDRIVVLGLGYVGLPLAVALARRFNVVGFDIDSKRVEGLNSGHDATREVSDEELASSAVTFTADPSECRGADLYIIAAPTPVNGFSRPDLSSLVAAARTVGQLLDPKRRPTVVIESTVYPGVTEEICGPEIESESGLKRGRDFRLGYSPERINPGDREHTIDKIPKVVAGEDDEVAEQLERIFGAITEGGTFRAASIKAAEAAKAIENAQRDINIAFINEVAQIFSYVGVSIWDVLEAARTKWNFLPFEPGLVGGHCIGVDPFYVSHLAERFGHHPEVILSGRGINDGMAQWIADTLHERRASKLGSVLVLGLTFKENLPDIRNSRSFDLVRRLTWLGHKVDVSDPLADADEVRREHGLELVEFAGQQYDMVIGAVAHDVYRQIHPSDLQGLEAPGGTLADIKGIWRALPLDGSIDRWTL